MCKHCYIIHEENCNFILIYDIFMECYKQDDTNYMRIMGRLF